MWRSQAEALAVEVDALTRRLRGAEAELAAKTDLIDEMTMAITESAAVMTSSTFREGMAQVRFHCWLLLCPRRARRAPASLFQRCHFIRMIVRVHDRRGTYRC